MAVSIRLALLLPPPGFNVYIVSTGTKRRASAGKQRRDCVRTQCHRSAKVLRISEPSKMGSYDGKEVLPVNKDGGTVGSVLSSMVRPGQTTSGATVANVPPTSECIEEALQSTASNVVESLTPSFADQTTFSTAACHYLQHCHNVCSTRNMTSHSCYQEDCKRRFACIRIYNPRTDVVIQSATSGGLPPPATVPCS